MRKFWYVRNNYKCKGKNSQAVLNTDNEVNKLFDVFKANKISGTCELSTDKKDGTNESYKIETRHERSKWTLNISKTDYVRPRM